VGETCDADTDCTSGLCVDDACKPTPAADGSPCKRDSNCASGVCSSLNSLGIGVCGPQTNGSACLRNQECTAGVCDQSVCGASNGTACTGDAFCQSGYCATSVCTAPLPTTEGCTRNAMCQTGLCTNGTCQCLGPLDTATFVAQCCTGTWTIVPASAEADGSVIPSHSACNDSAGLSCTLTAECETGQTCGGRGICCYAQGIAAAHQACCSGALDSSGNCTGSATGSACKAGDECASGTCTNQTCA
jgi:hypothetical protein